MPRVVRQPRHPLGGVRRGHPADVNSTQGKKGNPMIEVLSDMPEGVAGIRVSGRLLGDDLRDFRPTMEELLKAAEIRIVEVIAPDYGVEGGKSQCLPPPRADCLTRLKW